MGRGLSPGVYAIDQRLLQPGKYRIRVGVESRGAGFDVIDATDFDVGLTQAPAASAGKTASTSEQASAPFATTKTR